MGNHNWDFNVTEKDKIYIENKEEYLSEKEARDKRLEIYIRKRFRKRYRISLQKLFGYL